MGDKKAQKAQAAQQAQKEKEKEKEKAKGESGGSSNKVVIALLVVAIVILLVMGVGVGFIFMKGGLGKGSTAANTTNTVQTTPKETTQTKENVTIKKLQLDEFVTNLADGNNTYVKIKIALGYITNDTATELKSKSDEVRHVINMTLMSKKSSDLKGGNLTNVINELVEKINGLLVKGKVTNIYIDNILIS